MADERESLIADLQRVRDIASSAIDMVDGEFSYTDEHHRETSEKIALVQSTIDRAIAALSGSHGP